ncbi:nucleotidyltransferase [Tumebacillus sp. ITR2]|uniref:Nucleotidyltransferase n=1 Tax=Tumebacillus amylolyticus TaxID=2801339 RepID=A0ABS1J5U1_9BACL|nr:nucleotidyltransferase [Tumebacillus amylolyticus]MBL0385619.1 nucleotidyltransferase [Tumebacillus amylolyticus]
MFNTKNEQLDDLLRRICESLQVTPTMYALAESRYKAVADWLDRWDEPMQLQIYPQGSFRIGTTVKPIKGEEFDLDFVCEFSVPWQSQNPHLVLQKMYNRMKEHGTYQGMVELKRRCIRVNYRNEFHMDILPAFPVDDTGCLKVPDRELGWKDSNPKGYAEWFEEQGTIQKMEFVDKRAEVEPLRGHETAEEKTILAKIVQLIKRHRDVSFEDDLDNAPISIVLTTLAAKHYAGHRSVFQGLLHIVNAISIDIVAVGNGRIQVLNPRNSAEDLSERWDGNRKLYSLFVDFVRKFQNELMSVQHAVGIDAASKLLMSMFGENVTQTALRKQAEAMQNYRTTGKLAVNSKGTLTSAAVVGSTLVKGNTFFGSEE